MPKSKANEKNNIKIGWTLLFPILVGAYMAWFALFLNGSKSIAPLLEELCKLLGIVWLNSMFCYKRHLPYIGAALGLGFGMSETIFYVQSGIGLVNYYEYIPRLYSAVPLHMFTGLFIGVGLSQSRWHIKIIWFLSSVLLHYFYNYVVTIVG
jgi:RsiW-degrading membrane proteinase PrsW (M82 family)